MGDGLSDINAGRGFLLTRGGCGARADTPGIPLAAWHPCRHPASTPAFFWMRACFLTACMGPPGRAVHFREFSASRGGCIRAGSVYLISRDPSTGDLGWRTASGAAIISVSRRTCPKTMPIARCSRFAAPPAGATMLKTPDFARPKRGYVGTGRGAPVFLCMAQAKICKTVGHHAPDAQIGRAVRRRSLRAVRELKGEGSYGRAGGPADGGAAAVLALAVGDRALWAPALDARMLLLATHDVADAQALDISDIITL